MPHSLYRRPLCPVLSWTAYYGSTWRSHHSFALMTLTLLSIQRPISPFIEIFYQGVLDITGAALMTSMVTTLSLSAPLLALLYLHLDNPGPFPVIELFPAGSASSVSIPCNPHACRLLDTVSLTCVPAFIVLGILHGFQRHRLALRRRPFRVPIFSSLCFFFGDVYVETSSSTSARLTCSSTSLVRNSRGTLGVLLVFSGIMTNSFATVYLITIFPSSLWPPTNHQTATTINCSSLIFWGVR